MNKNNGDGTITFNFTLSEADAENLMSILQNEIVKYHTLILEEMAGSSCTDGKLIQYYKMYAESTSEMMKTILEG